MSELEVMNVHQLRRFARDIESFPIKAEKFPGPTEVNFWISLKLF